MNPSERIASWFFRLNGCAVIENFIVHPTTGPAPQRTDVDVLGVRFPYRRELLDSGVPMRDHEIFTANTLPKPLIIIAEVKTGYCRLNGPWTDPSRANMQRVLRAIGIVPECDVERVAKALYEHGAADAGSAAVRLFAVGSGVHPSHTLPRGAQPISWNDILVFIFRRMNMYWAVKKDHEQWDEVGANLYDSAADFRSSEESFVSYWMGKIQQR